MILLMLSFPLFLLGTVQCGGLNLGFKPEAVARVHYNGSSIPVWKHLDDSINRFFVLPLAIFDHGSLKVVKKVSTLQIALEFDVVMYNEDFFDLAVKTLKNVGYENVVREKVNLIPMTKLRVQRQSEQTLRGGIRLDVDWIYNFNSKSTITFRYFCDHEKICSELLQGLKQYPHDLEELHVESVVEAEKPSVRTVTVNGTNIKKTALFASLLNMNKAEGDIRYLNSEDAQELSMQAASRVVTKVITDGGYKPATDDEIKISDAIKMVVEKEEVDTSTFQDHQWDDVFWLDEFSRPDKVVKQLNEAYSKFSDSKNNAKDGSGEIGGGFKGFELKIGGKGGHNTVQNILEENKDTIDWTGEKFEVKPMKLYRVNLSKLGADNYLTSSSIQVNEVVATFSSQITVPDREISSETMKYSWEEIGVNTTRNDDQWLIKSKLRQCVDSYGIIVAPSDCGEESLVVENAIVYRKSPIYANWTTAHDHCKELGGKLFDDVSLNAKEMDEIGENTKFSRRGSFWTNIWSPANSGQWKNYDTGEVIPEKDIDWSWGEPDKDVARDRFAAFGCGTNDWWAQYSSDIHYYVCIMSTIM